MKTRIIKATLAVAFIAVAGYTAYNSQKEVELSDLAMANVEALANGGEVIPGLPCASVPNSTCIYFYPEYFELPGATYN